MKKRTAIFLFIATGLIALAAVQWQDADADRGRYSGLSGIPQGGIILWDKAAIPSGWAICDGNNGTPDLRNSFVPGAGDTYALNSTGGSLEHSHGGDTGSTTDTLSASPDQVAAGSAAPDYSATTNGHLHSIEAEADFEPPYHALYYIMKL